MLFPMKSSFVLDPTIVFPIHTTCDELFVKLIELPMPIALSHDVLVILGPIAIQFVLFEFDVDPNELFIGILFVPYADDKLNAP